MATINLTTTIPGPKSLAMVSRREAAMATGNAKLTNLGIASAHGAVVIDVDGNTLLDFAGGIGMLAIGHTPDAVVSKMQQQAQDLVHMCSIVASYEPLVALCELLNSITPGKFPKKTTLSNSGAEAVEAAIKMARAYTGRAGILVFEGAYHGRTNLTMGMTSKYALFKKGFGPFPSEIYRIPFPNSYHRPPEMSEEGYIEYMCQQFDHALVAQVDPNAIAAIVIEPVQGEGGFLPTPPRFLERIREACTQHGIVMIADEIQCGFGRTGKLFAIEHYNIVPDLITMGKSLAAGMPIAAVTGRAEIVDAPHAGGLGGTYSGNPLACVAAIEATNQIKSPEFLLRSEEIGKKLRAHLLHLQDEFPDLIGDVRGLGPMLAIEIIKDPESKAPDMETTAAITAATLKRGLITIRAGLYSNCIRFLPPLIISDDQLEEAMTVLKEALVEVASS